MSFINVVGNVQGAVGAVNNFADSILSMFGVDTTGVFDNVTFEQLFDTARPIKANINRSSKIMDHPIENGSIVSDFSIIMPVGIELSMILTGEEYASVYQEMKNYFLSRTLVSIQTRADVFDDMIIEAMPHEESPDMFDVLPVAFKFREVQMITVQYQSLAPQNVQSPTDESTVSRGAQQPQTSVLYDASQFLKGIF